MTDITSGSQLLIEPALAVESEVENRPQAGRTPICFVVDQESSVRRFVSLIMHGSGIDAEEFSSGNAFRTAIPRRFPDLAFLDVSLDAADTVESLTALAKTRYRGSVQLMSGRGSAVLEKIKSIGEQHKLNMLPVLKKPFETRAVQEIIHETKIGMPPPVAARIGLDEALRNNWIEFWYQPKIDLRKKQLSGVEAFARARHPQYGVLAPNTFLPGADDDGHFALSERAIIAAISAGMNFSKLGVHLRIAINIAAKTLAKLPVTDIVKSHRSELNQWPGMIIDISEDQIVTDIEFAEEMAGKLQQYNIKLAIDDFGRGYSTLIKHKTVPFAEIKLDRAFVTDCGSDKVNAPICKNVIDLAHNFGSAAVAVGIEKASDVVALLSMGCDYGQGYLLGQPMPEERFTALLRQRAR